jgi:hypothetical protein
VEEIKTTFTRLAVKARECHEFICLDKDLTRERRGELCVMKEDLYVQMMRILLPDDPFGPMHDQMKERMKGMVTRPNGPLDYESVVPKVLGETSFTSAFMKALAQMKVPSIPSTEEMHCVKVLVPFQPNCPTPWFSLPDLINAKDPFVYSSEACAAVWQVLGQEAAQPHAPEVSLASP